MGHGVHEVSQAATAGQYIRHSIAESVIREWLLGKSIHANFVLQTPILDVQCLYFLSQHSCNVALLALSNHRPAHYTYVRSYA